jgi:heat shock protein HslJ
MEVDFMRLYMFFCAFVAYIMLFAPKSFASEVHDLHQYNWQLLEINGAKLDADDVSLSFNADENILQGSATCNQFDGYYKAGGGYIRISASAEQNICDDMAEMHTEDMLLLALNYAKTYAIYGNKLVLFNDIGQRIASFRGELNENYASNHLNINNNSKKEQKTSFLWLTF